MQLKPANTILNKTEFSNEADWEIYPTADYHCSICQQEVAISFKNLSKHSRLSFSNLSPIDKAAVDLFENQNPKTKTNSFLDFYCPKCTRPVRIYYDAWAGGHHGEYGFSIKYVLD